MAASICEKFNNIHLSEETQKSRCDQFHVRLKDVAARVGLKKSYVDRIQEWAVDASEEDCFEGKREVFVKSFTDCMEQIAEPVLERSCFLRKRVSDLQMKMDLVHYTCLKAFDTAFGNRDESYLEWVDRLYDRGLLTAAEALLIPALMRENVRSLMRCEYDESYFSDLLSCALGQKEAALFAAELLLTKADFPIREAEIVLFTEVVHALFKQPCDDRRALFQEFLDGFVKSFRRYNAESKDMYLSYVKEILLVERKVPDVECHVKPVPKIKLEANRYWFLRIYDTVVENCRSPFAEQVDALFDRGYLTHCAANELLDLADSPRKWTKFNLSQQLMSLQEKHRWDFDISILKKPFLASIER